MKTELEIKVIDPLNITDFCIVFVDDKQGFFGWLIKSHEKGNWNHVCILYKPGYVASQDPLGYRSVPITAYLKPRYSLKFMCFRNIYCAKELEVFKSIVQKLNKPWWKRRYDYLGILGQAIGCRWIQTPWADYCSEDVRKRIIMIEPTLDKVIPKRPTPSELNDICNQYPDKFHYIGHWFMD